MAVLRKHLVIWMAAGLAVVAPLPPQLAADQLPCTKDAVLVFDASGSMAGPGFGEKSTTRMDTARQALAEILPEVAPVRNLGLIVFGPGERAPGACAHIDLRLPPAANSAERIMSEIDRVQPYGQTPIAASVEAAAEVLDFRKRPAVIVLLTDGEETCGGNPCALADRLKREGRDTTVHVIGYMVSKTSGMPAAYPTRCLPERTNGLYVSAETKQELVSALRRTLACSYSSERDRRPDRSQQSVRAAAPRDLCDAAAGGRIQFGCAWKLLQHIEHCN
jgi:Ca-activated chloride channel family protein